MVQGERAEGSHPACSLHLYKSFCFSMTTTCSWPGLNWLFCVQKANAHAQNFYRAGTARWCGLCPSPNSWGFSLEHTQALKCVLKSQNPLTTWDKVKVETQMFSSIRAPPNMGSPELRRAGGRVQNERWRWGGHSHRWGAPDSESAGSWEFLPRSGPPGGSCPPLHGWRWGAWVWCGWHSVGKSSAPGKRARPEKGKSNERPLGWKTQIAHPKQKDQMKEHTQETISFYVPQLLFLG